MLWFAWKSVPLWYLKQHKVTFTLHWIVVICLKICTFVVSKTTSRRSIRRRRLLWFAWKSVPLWYLKQPSKPYVVVSDVVICLKICTFVVSKTTCFNDMFTLIQLWFAWKSVPLWYLKQQVDAALDAADCCDLLENLYLCGI